MFKVQKLADATLAFIRVDDVYTHRPTITVRCTVHNETVEVVVHSDRWLDVAREAYRLKVLHHEDSSYYNTICNVCLGLSAKMVTFYTPFFDL